MAEKNKILKKKKKQLSEFFSTLFHSWGGDTPSEAIWAANDLLPYLENDFPGISKESFMSPFDEGGSENNEEILSKYFGDE